MRTAKMFSAMMVAFLFAAGADCSGGDPTDLTPRIDTRQDPPKLILPPQILAEMQHSFPGYRVPGDKEKIQEWAKGRDFPYVAWGDFDGNGLTDVVLILLSEEKWTLTVFHQQKGNRYTALSLFVAGTKTSNDERMQACSLLVIKKNTPYEIEHWEEGRGPATTETLKFPVDAFQLSCLDIGMRIYHWSDGRYEKIIQAGD